jgi:hypothetical protein
MMCRRLRSRMYSGSLARIARGRKILELLMDRQETVVISE